MFFAHITDFYCLTLGWMDYASVVNDGLNDLMMRRHGWIEVNLFAVYLCI